MRIITVNLTSMNDRLPPSAPKRPTNLSVNAALLDKAKRLGINLSQTLEDHLARLVSEAEGRAWLDQNKAAIEAFNQRVEKEGLWSDDLRCF